MSFGGGCTRTFAKEAVQPNPLVHPTETLRTSEKITIVTGDMDLEAPAPAEWNPNSINASLIHNHMYPLFNQASFTVVSRDRLKFHVQVDHKWQEYADLRTWTARLTDDQGHTWVPEAVERARSKVLTTMWDREQRTAICDGAGRSATGDCYNTIGFANDGWKRRQTLGTLSVFRGNADFVFYQRDIMSPQVRWVKLVIERSGEAFEFTWRFEDTIAAK